MSTNDSGIKNWSITPNDNNSTPPQGWPEGMKPSDVNNTARQQMADHRYQWEDAEWFVRHNGTELSQASATTFKISSDVTGSYYVDRRVKLFDGSTLYGVVTAASFSSPDTTVTVELDSGSLTSSLTAVALAVASPRNRSLPDNLAINPNMLVNGQFRISQRATSFTSTNSANNDDVYTLDRWVLLSDGNDVVDVTQDTSTVPTGSPAAIKLEVETINKKFGIVQILEQRDAEAIISGRASLSFKARNAASDDNTNDLRAAIISWSGTANSVTSDVVSAWENSSTNPTLATNWTYENTATANTLTQSYQTFKIQNVSVDTASTKNVAVFIWCNNTDGALDDAIYISDVKLEKGSVCTAYPAENENDTISRAQRYYQKIHNTTGANRFITIGLAQGAGRTYAVINFPGGQMRANATITATASDLFPSDGAGGSEPAFSTINSTLTLNNLFFIDVSGSSGLTSGQACPLSLINGGLIEIDAEL